MYSYNFLITIRLTYEELCIKFLSILIGPKKFYRHFKKLLGISKNDLNFKFQFMIIYYYYIIWRTHK
ncbi:hypothetical protein FWK35_00029625 [Aphis craccivora]|uniref:Uncharacterized protein n=1 Tax=Aphis craccivora TaxID=307492 RepID=A0A6G0Z5K2_APHCR|nr:hypothetical protein FWK35_00029625 [Aphis craccivora]